MKAIFTRLFQLILLALGSWVAMLFLSWPALGGVAIFFGAIGVYFGWRLARRLWLVSRSRVKLAASEAAGRQPAAAHDGRLAELTSKWKAAIATLRRSSLRRFGNPIYALPWYMVIGESGVGKTSAITRARASSLNKAHAALGPITQTLNCDWWFFNRTVIIDTAGRYVSPDGTPEDQAEWDRMLELLAKYRIKEGLNGLVVAVEAETLRGDPHALEARGLAMRERINQLIRLFDKRFPIFVMLTKADRIYGFEQWAATLPPDSLAQAMGYVGPLEEGDEAEARFADQALDQIIDRLRQLRLDMGVKGVELSAPLLLLPAEVERLRSGLKRFLSACMGNNPYLEQPLLRGLFLSSARQDGQTLPSLLSALAAHGATPTPAAASAKLDTPEPDAAHVGGEAPVAAAQVPVEQGLFLHDFFERVLPADRWTFRPTAIVDRWRLATRNLAAVFWICAFVAGLLFLALSYQQTRSSVLAIRDAYPVQTQVENPPVEQRLQNLTDLLRLIELIQNHERNWQTRWLAFSPDLDALEEAIKQRYVRGYVILQHQSRQQKLLPALRQPDAEDSAAYAQAVLTLTRDINLTQARLDGASYNELLRMPQPPETLSDLLGVDLPAELAQAPAHMTAAARAWSDADDPGLLAGLRADRTLLAQVVAQSENFSWLLEWADRQPELKPTTLRDFWLPGSTGTEVADAIPAALTRAGMAQMEGFLDEIGQALNLSTQFQFKRGAFDAWYQTERFNAWQSFAWSFDNGEQLLANEPAWHNLVTRVDTNTSPYYALFERLGQEFADTPEDQLPSLVLFAREFPALRRAASGQSLVNKAHGVVDVINTVGRRLVHPLTTPPNASVTASGTLRRSIQGVSAFEQYEHQFDVAAAQALKGSGQAYQLVADYFNLGADTTTDDSALQAAQDSLLEFRKASGFDQPDDQVIWRLVGGPLRVLTRYALEQASCHVQQDWEEAVLWKTQMSVTPRETSDLLFGDQGTVWAFVDGPAKPFIQRRASLFTPVRRDDFQFPFDHGFIPFLNQSVAKRVDTVVKTRQAEAAKGTTATILITAQPLGVNPGAKAKPYAANLSIQCAQQEVTLDNFNMEVTNSFDWSPEQCGDVTLRISIADLTLTQRYPGPMGMARFVAEFHDGQRIFTPNDFPQARDELEALGVRTLSVRYDFSGQDQLLELARNLDYLADTGTPTTAHALEDAARHVPERVGQCWTQGPPQQTASPIPLFIRQRADQLLDQPAAAGAVSLPAVRTPSGPGLGILTGNPRAASTPPAAAEPAPQAAARDAAPPQPQRQYTVQPGDTLFSVARRFGTTPETLQHLNQLKNTDLILVGQVLKLPPAH